LNGAIKVALALQLGGTERNTRKINIRAIEELRKKKTILRILKSEMLLNSTLIEEEQNKLAVF